MSDHPKLPDIVERLREVRQELHENELADSGTFRGNEYARWGAAVAFALIEIERFRRTSSIGWEEAIEAAAKVADETAALEDKHDRYEAYRAAHDIAQTIRSLLPSIAAPPNKEKP